MAKVITESLTGMNSDQRFFIIEALLGLDEGSYLVRIRRAFELSKRAEAQNEADFIFTSERLGVLPNEAEDISRAEKRVERSDYIMMLKMLYERVSQFAFAEFSRLT